MQRRIAGTEATYPLMRHAFDDLGYRRFEWRCDSLNARSRVAGLRYGFTFEGVFRNAAVVKGHSRDTAWFSIIREEWPSVKAAFEDWLRPANFNDMGQQRRTLADVRGQRSAHG